MSDFAVMPLTDYSGACEVIREKTGDTDLIKSGELAGKIKGVYSAGQLSLVQNSEHIYPTISGSVIAVNDVNEVEHDVKVKLTSKNLATAQQVYGAQTKIYYSELVEDERNCIRFVDCAVVVAGKNIPFKENTRYTFSFDGKREIRGDEGYATSVFLRIYYTDGTSNNIAYNNTTMPYGEWVHCSYTSLAGKTIEKIGVPAYHWLNWLYIDVDTFQIEESATATAYTPYIENFSGIKVSRYGKNLLNTNGRNILASVWITPEVPLTLDGNTIFQGISWSNYRQSGQITGMTIGDTISFTSATNYYGVGFDIKVKPNTTYTISVGEATNMALYINFYDKDGNYLTWYGGTACGHTVTTTAATEWLVVILRCATGGELATFKNIQLEAGSSAIEYEPYIEPQVIEASSDGTVEGITSLSPNMTLMPDTSGVIMDCQYCRDIDLYIDSLNVATTGGET